jgi:hypothetical protein
MGEIMNRSKAIGQLAAVAALVATSAFAGEKRDIAVIVDTVNRFAVGSMGTARNSFDGNQNIGCIVHADLGINIVQCSARNAAGVTRLCNTGNQNLVNAVIGMQSDALISFGWDGDAQCTSIHISNYSIYTPKR